MNNISYNLGGLQMAVYSMVTKCSLLTTVLHQDWSSSWSIISVFDDLVELSLLQDLIEFPAF